MATKPLANIHVVITRPKENAKALIALLEQSGASVIAFPTVAIEAISIKSENLKKLHPLNAYDMLIFTSVYAVQHAMPYIKSALATLSPKTKFIAIGDATKEKLRQQSVLKVISPKEKFGSEALLQMPEFDQCQGKRILIFSGENPRPLLKNSLMQRQAQVESVAVYRRMPIKADPQI
ncbi:MAG: uroporphyrinogen-III synthase, partial [Pseudomonadota bacterium]